MDMSRLSQGELIAGGSGLALLVVMFLPWYGVDVSAGGFSASESANAWEVFSGIDIVLFLVGALAVGVAGARLAGVDLPPDLPVGTIVAGAGALAVLLILFRILDVPGPDIPSAVESNIDFGRKIGLFLGLVAASGVAYGGYRALSETPSAASTPPPAPAQ